MLIIIVMLTVILNTSEYTVIIVSSKCNSTSSKTIHFTLYTFILISVQVRSCIK